MNLAQVSYRAYLLHQILLLGCGIAGFVIASRRCAWREKILRWLGSAALIGCLPALLEGALNRYIPLGDRSVFVGGFPQRGVDDLPVAVAVILMSLAYRGRRSALGRAAEAAALAAVGLAAAAVMARRLYRTADYFPLEDLIPGAGFGICCWITAAAYESAPRKIRGVGLASAAAFALYCGVFIRTMKEILPNPDWSTERLVSALAGADGSPPSCLGDNEKVVQLSAAKLLAARGPAALPALRRALAQTNPQSIQEGAALALAKMGPLAAPALPELMDAWPADGRGILTNWNLIQALSAVGAPTMPLVLRRIERGTPGEARDGGYVLGGMGTAGLDAAIGLSRSLRRPSRLAAVPALAGIAKKSPEASSALAVLLGDADFDVSYEAAREFEGGGFPTSKSAITRLRKALRSDRRWVRASAAIAIARALPRDPAARSVLIDSMNEEIEEMKEDIPGERLKLVLWAFSWGYKGDPVVRDVLNAALRRAKKEKKDRLGSELAGTLAMMAAPDETAARRQGPRTKGEIE